MEVMGIGEVVAIDKFLAVEMFDFSDPLLKRCEHGVKAGAPRKGSAGNWMKGSPHFNLPRPCELHPPEGWRDNAPRCCNRR